MPGLVRPLCSLLAALTVLVGGAVDLCGCEAGVHGALCLETEETEAPASVSEPCCGSHGCCAEEAPPPTAVIGPGCCGCPVVSLDISTAEVDSGAPLVLPAGDPAQLVVRSPAAPLEAGEPTAGPSARPPPSATGRVRRHLLLKVLRC